MSRLVLFLLLLLPAACATPGEPGTMTPETTVEKPAVLSRKPQQESAAKPEDTPKSDSVAALPLPQFDLLPPNQTPGAGLPGKNALKAERLIGMLDSDLERILGTPDFRRNDPPAQIWQYRKPTCLFDVFLYQDKTRKNAYAVTHIEARGLDVNLVSGEDCYLSVLNGRNPK